MKDFTVMAWALVALALAAWVELLGLRQPIRDGLATARAWLVAQALALRSMVTAFGREVRDFWRWVGNPAPIQTSGTTESESWVGGDWYEFPITWTTTNSGLDGWTATYWPPEQSAPVAGATTPKRRKPRPKPAGIAKKARKRKRPR